MFPDNQARVPDPLTKNGYFSKPAKTFAKVCASPGHRAET
jgi:hypothetical protein